MLNIQIKTIPSSEHRYSTCGDYWIDQDGSWQIRVSDMGNWHYEMAVAIHELWEQSLCFDRGIKEEDISNFDIQFEKEREEGKHSEMDEPGDNENAPYVKEHCSATGIERLFISEVNEKFKEYDEACFK